ncbi:hypothetical protein ACFSSC_06545 [Corynebacterium mendelii]|uniref:DUF4230 domain-containing protein n=1 Tax=Corynebacterium mendelii TaxID=2765362 RepID=A0A939E0E6_9CORY|nr:hypothetical protein [Corynebacterium mendelii]MBN9644634.1 hypothetical protein [Corynebacterium mendelii]
MKKFLLTLLGVLIGVAVTLAVIAGAGATLWNTVDTDSSTHSSQVVKAVTKEEKVVLLALHMQGITSREQTAQLFGKTVPGTARNLYLQYEYTAMLGIDGSRVTITPTGEHAYSLTIPDFSFLGTSDVTFKKAVEDNGIISFVTADIDEAAMINDILGPSSKDKQIDDNRAALQSQARSFYGDIVRAIDPAADITVTFR